MSLVRLRPRPDTIYVSQGRSVLSFGHDGFIEEGSTQGLYVHETRLLSRHCYLIDGVRPTPVALSSLEQHSWRGYYIHLPPGIEAGAKDTGSGQVPEAAQQTLELRLSRYVGEGFHEDVDLTNYTQRSTRFRLELEGATPSSRSASGGSPTERAATRSWTSADGCTSSGSRVPGRSPPRSRSVSSMP